MYFFIFPPLYIVGPVKLGHRLVNILPALAYLLQAAVHQNPPLSDEDDPLCQRLNVLHVVGGEDHRRDVYKRQMYSRC